MTATDIAPQPPEKRRLSELAIMGGQPAFRDPLHVGRPNLGSKEELVALVEDIYDRRWLTNDGPVVREFERRIAGYLEVRHCIATCNGTVALELAARALDLSGEVIVPSFTFVATAHALRWQGVTPIFCDVLPGLHTIDPYEAERLISPRTSAILGVHIWGSPCDVDRLQDVTGRHGLALLFDAAHAFGTTWRGRRIGGFGNAEVFSFHATKVLNSGEGGAVTTNDDALAARLRLLRNFGFTGYDQVEYLGVNGKLSELAAALGLVNLRQLEAFIEDNHRNLRTYRRRVATMPGIGIAELDEHSNCHYIPVEVESTISGLSRDEIMDVLWAENVLARRYFFPGCHRMEPYRANADETSRRLPITESLTTKVLVLPTGSAVGPAEIDVLCDVLDTALRNPAQIRAAVARQRNTTS